MYKVQKKFELTLGQSWCKYIEQKYLSLATVVQQMLDSSLVSWITILYESGYVWDMMNYGPHINMSWSKHPTVDTQLQLGRNMIDRKWFINELHIQYLTTHSSSYSSIIKWITWLSLLRPGSNGLNYCPKPFHWNIIKPSSFGDWEKTLNV